MICSRRDWKPAAVEASKSIWHPWPCAAYGAPPTLHTQAWCPRGSAKAMHFFPGELPFLVPVCWQTHPGMTANPRRYRTAVVKKKSGRDVTPSARVATRKAPPSGPLQLWILLAASGCWLLSSLARCLSIAIHQVRWRLGKAGWLRSGWKGLGGGVATGCGMALESRQMPVPRRPSIASAVCCVSQSLRSGPKRRSRRTVDRKAVWQRSAAPRRPQPPSALLRRSW